MIQIIEKFSKEKRFKQIYFAWNPQKSPLFKILTDTKRKVLSATTLSNGPSNAPFFVVEIAVP
jgi:hypothetical protein